MKILIVDDHPAIVSGLRYIVEKNWDLAEIAEAKNISEAVAIIEQGGLSLIILDLSLPDTVELDGVLEVQLKAPSTPLLIYSFQHEITYAPTLLKIGVAGFLSKAARRFEA